MVPRSSCSQLNVRCIVIPLAMRMHFLLFVGTINVVFWERVNCPFWSSPAVYTWNMFEIARRRNIFLAQSSRRFGRPLKDGWLGVHLCLVTSPPHLLLLTQQILHALQHTLGFLFTGQKKREKWGEAHKWTAYFTNWMAYVLSDEVNVWKFFCMAPYRLLPWTTPSQSEIPEAKEQRKQLQIVCSTSHYTHLYCTL